MRLRIHLKRLGWGICSIILLFLLLYGYVAIPPTGRIWIERTVGIGILILIVYFCGAAIEFALNDLRETLNELREMKDE